MLADRGYVISDADAPPLADPCTPRLTAHRASDSSRKIVAIFCEAEQTKKQDALGHTQNRETESKAKREETSRKRQSTKAEREERKKQKEAERRFCDYYLARRTLIEMFSDRGYIVPNMDAEIANFRLTFGDHPEAFCLGLTAHSASDSSRKIVALFCEDYQTKKEDAVGIMSEISKKEMAERVILVMQREMDFDAQKVLDESPVKVETFMISELRRNIPRRLSNPKFEIFSGEDKDKLLEDVELLKMCYDLGDIYYIRRMENYFCIRLISPSLDMSEFVLLLVFYL